MPIIETIVPSESKVAVRRWRCDDGVELVGEVWRPDGNATVLLLHGGGQTRFSWAGTVSACVEAGYRVVNADARGHGESGWSPDGCYPLYQRASDMTTLLKDYSGPVALVGASLGGATAMKALANGFRPAAVVLVDMVPRPDPQGVARVRAFMTGHPNGFRSIDEAADAIAEYNPHRRRPHDLAGLRRNLRLGADGRLHWHWDPGILSVDPVVEIAEFEQLVDGLVDASDVPLLLIRGAESDLVNEKAMLDLAARVPNLETVSIAGAGHMVAGDRNDSFTAAILAFLTTRLPVDK